MSQKKSSSKQPLPPKKKKKLKSKKPSAQKVKPVKNSSFSSQEVATGILKMHHKGFGFVVPDDPIQHPQDIFIPKHLTGNAVDSDHVEVAINLESHSEKGPEGKIICIIKRAHQHLAGTIRNITSSGDIMAYVPLLGTAKPVVLHSTEDLNLKIGDRVVLKVIEWGKESSSTIGQAIHVIGNISDPSVDVQAAMEEFDLRANFPKSAIEQAKKFGKKVPTKEMAQRTDLTKKTSFTIDPDTAKDFDDALSISKDRKGNYSLSVHIADVAHYVKAGTALDKEAILRANSTYFPGVCIPMLPEELSNELCSLKPNVIRLTVSVLMQFDKSGTLTHYEIVRSFIKSAKRFTYFEAKDILEGKIKSPHKAALKLMVELCLLLKNKRTERGSIDFALPELVVLVDKNGMPQGIKKIEYDITHQLVEEFMLKANEVVATDLTKRGKQLIYRVHEKPQEENFTDFLNFARTLGLKIAQKPTPQELQQLFLEAKNTPHLTQLTVAFIRSMKLAQYSTENVGHYGLALEYYCHFTSPIRRYSDLIIQRLLFDEEPEHLNTVKIAEECSAQERVSFKAEMSVKTLKKLRLLKHYFKEEPYREFDATITKIKPFGLYFELQEMLFEGFLHISELDNDYFIYDEKRVLLSGRHTGKLYRLGDLIKIRIAHIDLIVSDISWILSSDRMIKSKSSFFKSRHNSKKRRKK